MLAAQAEAANRLFLDCPARPELAYHISDEFLKSSRNIALIGMPGCGKTTVGRLLAAAMGRPFADIDELIEAEAGKPIPAIFAEEGEDAFRKLETRVLGNTAKQSGLVIATGGGVVTRPENFGLLRQNSLIVYVRGSLATLATSGRPLSQGVGIETLAKQRLPLYEAWSDCSVALEGTPEQTVMKLQEVTR
jgi:shikimate dehydrogenase